MIYIYVPLLLGVLTILIKWVSMSRHARKNLITDLREGGTSSRWGFILAVIVTILFLWPYALYKDIVYFASRLYMDRKNRSI